MRQILSFQTARISTPPFTLSISDGESDQRIEGKQIAVKPLPGYDELSRSGGLSLIPFKSDRARAVYSSPVNECVGILTLRLRSGVGSIGSGWDAACWWCWWPNDGWDHSSEWHVALYRVPK